jgi:2'-5' RNA ligase
MRSLQMPNTSLYFIAILLPGDISAEITAFKQEVADVYNSKKALRVMPHITLKAPFTVNSNEGETVLKWFTNIKTDAEPFGVKLDGFGAFDNAKNPVIFVKPEASNEMAVLQKQVIAAFKNQFPGIPVHFHEEEFHPHITIAYRDLEYAEFEKAWTAFKDREYKAGFVVSDFSLLKHNGERWELVYVFKL